MTTTIEERAMKSEIYTPFTNSYNDHLRRLHEYQEQYLKHYHETSKDRFGDPITPFEFSESKLLCCSSQEIKWIHRAVVKAENDSFESHCLSMMNSISAHLRSVCECTLEHTPRKVLRMFITKVCVFCLIHRSFPLRF